MRARMLVAAAAAATVLLAGCGDRTSGEAAAPSASGQADVRAPVTARATEPAAPTGITIDGARTAVEAVATDPGGALYPPQDVAKVGWWVDSALPGSGAGSVVIAGHVDDARQGDGYAKRFSALAPGDRVTLTGADGRAVEYRVDRTVSVDKARLPVDDLNRLDGPETLILITCGGRFVGPPIGYENNDVAYAVRA